MRLSGIPEVMYARSGDVAIAYQAIGFGPSDIVFVRGITGDLLSTWEQPLLVRHIEGLATCGRVLMLDKRGTGLSDRVREVQSLETTMDDVRAVMDAAGSARAVLFTGSTSTGIGALFAATYPERCSGLVLIDPQGHSLDRLPVGADRGGVAGAVGGRACRLGRAPLPRAACRRVGAGDCRERGLS